MKRAPQWVGTCVGLREQDLNDFDDSSREIKYRTFLKHLGREIVRELDLSFGVPLRRDWGVSFEKGKWRGRPAVCLFQSSIHHIWLI